MTIEKLDEDILKYLQKFTLRADEINHLIGICRKPEGREFLFSKIEDASVSLEMVRFLIKKQFRCDLCVPKKKYEKARRILEVIPDLQKQKIADIVGCSVRHVERVIYGEI